MALVLKADNSTLAMPKVIETKNNMIFHGQCYNKNNLVPIPLENIIISSTKNMLNTNKRIRPAALANCCEVWNDDMIISDEYESNIFYIVLYNGANFYIIKCREIQNKIEVITSVNLAVYYDKYLGQDENYLYFAFRAMGTFAKWYVYIGNNDKYNANYFYIQVIKVDKKNLTHSQIGSYPYYYTHTALSIPTCIKIFEDKNYIYCGGYTNLDAASGYVYYYRKPLRFNIHRIVKSNNSMQAIKTNITINADGIYNFFDNKDIFKISDSVIGFYLIVLTNKINPFKLIKLNLNETVVTNISTIENVVFEWNENKESLSVFPDGSWYSYETFITKVGNRSFVNLIMYQNANQYVTAQIVNQGLYTFEMIDFNNLKFINYSPISDAVLKGYLLSKDRRFLIVSTANSTIFMKFDAEDGYYKITNTLESVPVSIGLDLSERVWIMKADSEVDVYSLSDTTDFNIKFEKDYYDYTGENIETFITIEAKNFVGEYVSTKIELNIDGNAKFKENGDKVIQLVTPTDGSLKIPVVITGSNQITIYSKILR